MAREDQAQDRRDSQSGSGDIPALLEKPGNARRLYPYVGGIPNHRPGNIVRWEAAEDQHGFDKYLEQYHNPELPEKYRLDGDWSYEFNSLGFRGEEYRPDAPRHIFACGCSYTYGMGIKWHQTFPAVFREKYAELHGLAPEQVNLLNFGQQAASNDYIARTVLAQCSQVRPDFLLVLFTSKERFEYVDEDKVGVIGPWISDEWSQNYYRFYTEEIGLINTLKNILLVQNCCKLQDIPYMFSLFYHGELSNPRFNSHPVIAPLMMQIDWEHFTPFSLIDFRCDVGRMGHHPGPLSNLRFGRKLFVYYQKLRDSGVVR